ncbi:dNTP triphosphohydrolase, broad substrate specificity [hydrothermal vent metagenome]|uniref:DNTP triphosphohydrolase, broad substrate specificity n=1 Tax=hydrothermal vent metagenome TaxID=652676 RepID=A0A3B1A4A2_9ZZZZ
MPGPVSNQNYPYGYIPGRNTDRLAPYAMSEQTSRGRHHAEPPPGYRGEYQRDRDRIVHSAAFRRLEYKTQVFVNHEGDMFRTRLTHSIEVAQIGRAMARVLGLNEDLTEAIALAHDLGHTPFGHAGQDALNKCMQHYDGFEHNIQSLRVVDVLEERYAEFSGLNLTFESREGILKHCSKKRAMELGDVGERFLQHQQPGLEAQLANKADEIAYNNHDVDDGLRSGFITIEQLLDVAIFAKQYEIVQQTYSGLSERRTIHEVIRRMINVQVTDLIETSISALTKQNPRSVNDVRQNNTELIVFSDEMAELLLTLKQFLRHNLYQHYRVRRMSVKASKIISALFGVFLEDNKLMPPETMTKATHLKSEQGDAGTARAVSDYIAGMTDRYAIKEYERIFNPSHLT